MLRQKGNTLDTQMFAIWTGARGRLSEKLFDEYLVLYIYDPVRIP